MKKTVIVVLLLTILLGCFNGCGKTPATSVPKATNDEQKTTDTPVGSETSGSLRWPKFGVCTLLPEPPSKEGYIHEDGSDEADIDVYEITQDDFYNYAAQCQDKGFVIDYYFDETDYEAYNADDYYLWLDYDQETKVMNIWIYYDEGYGEEKNNEAEEDDQRNENVESESTEEPEETTEETTEESKNDSSLSNGIRPDFKEAMDSYEAFMDEYVEFMKKYQKNPGDLTLLKEYAEFMADYAEFAEAFEEWTNEDMNNAELAYYLEVQARVTKKLTEIA